MPDYHAEFVLVATGKRGDVGLGADAGFEDRLQRYSVGAVNGDSLTGHLAEHPEDVEHVLVQAVAGKGAQPGEIGLVFKLEGAGQGARKVHAVLLGPLLFASE